MRFSIPNPREIDTKGQETGSPRAPALKFPPDKILKTDCRKEKTARLLVCVQVANSSLGEP